MEYKVKRCQLHQPVDLKGVITKKTLSGDQPEMMGAILTFNELGVMVKFKGETFIIPSANIAGVVVDE